MIDNDVIWDMYIDDTTSIYKIMNHQHLYDKTITYLRINIEIDMNWDFNWLRGSSVDRLILKSNKNITITDIDNMIGLHSLSIYNINIGTLPDISDLKLHTLRLCNNNINSISIGDYQSIKELYIYMNPIVDLSWINYFPNIDTLSCRYGIISEVPVDIGRIRKVILSGNCICSLNDLAQGTYIIEYIDLSDNLIDIYSLYVITHLMSNNDHLSINIVDNPISNILKRIKYAL